MDRHAEARLSELRQRRNNRARRRSVRRKGLAGVGLVLLAAVAVASVYAGSSDRIARGVHIAGVDVGGLTPVEATRVLRRSETALNRVPLDVRMGSTTYEVSATDLGLRVNWPDAIAEAREEVGGFAPIRGLRRLKARAFGVDIAPEATVDRTALRSLLDRLGRDDLASRDAAIRLVGLRPVVVPEKEGLALDRQAAEAAIVGALVTLDRTPVTLTATTEEPEVTAEMLEPSVEQVRTAISRPVRLVSGNGFTLVSKRELAGLLDLPSGGETAIAIAGPRADRYFAELSKKINTKPQDAEFMVATATRVLVKPSVNGRALDVPRTAKRLLAAALRPTNRTARMVIGTKAPARTTAEARKMGITGLVGGYTTSYSGDANRVHNVRLVADLIDRALIPPGTTFSFNGTTGERNADKGFREAPVIINGELQTGLGGGVCQVSTTVFNAAYEAGLDITERTNHALYISHYPQGRDATVNYPDLDLKFVNDTGKWLLLRTFVGSSSLTVNLYGAPQGRRVESEVAPLEVTGTPPTTWRKDPSLFRGQRVVSDGGSSPLATSVRRKVYDTKGTLLYEDVWYSSYRGEKKIVLVGTKPRPKPEPKQDEAAPPTETAPTETTPVETTPVETTPGT